MTIAHFQCPKKSEITAEFCDFSALKISDVFSVPLLVTVTFLPVYSFVSTLTVLGH